MSLILSCMYIPGAHVADPINATLLCSPLEDVSPISVLRRLSFWRKWVSDYSIALTWCHPTALLQHPFAIPKHTSFVPLLIFFPPASHLLMMKWAALWVVLFPTLVLQLVMFLETGIHSISGCWSWFKESCLSSTWHLQRVNLILLLTSYHLTLGLSLCYCLM